MFGRQEGGSVICPSCGNLVGVRDSECLNCGRRNPGLWGFAPLLAKFGRGALDDLFVQGVIVACSILFVASLLVGGIRMGGFLSFLSPGPLGLFLFGASGEQWVFGYGRWWTIFSATWLHGGIIHIFFNMYWVRMIGPSVIEFYGLGRMVIIYTIAGATGFLMTSSVNHYFPWLPFPLSGANVTIGASAAIFGLIGALVHYGHRSGSRAVYQQSMQWALFLFIFGLIMPGVDNWAHLGGFVGGYAASRWMDPLHPERLDHTLGAFACLVITGASIAWSVITGLPMLP
jgi:rhomboid protease GluP